MEAMISREIVNFCAIECRLQMSGELSVAWMVDAWLYAQAVATEVKYEEHDGTYGKTLWEPVAPTVTDVLNIGKLVEPNDNALGFRRVGVQVGFDVKMDWQDVPRQIVNLMEAVRDGAFEPRSLGEGISSSRYDGAAEFFKAYEEIHPFIDGNGRSGVCLFNWLNGTLDHPVWPPNYWSDPRRTVGYGA